MRIVLIVILLLISVAGYSPTIPEAERVKKFERSLIDLRIKEIKILDFSERLLVEYLTLKYPDSGDVPLRQFILETGWFSHERFVVYNNIAGMRLAKIRDTTATGMYKKHAKYNHWTCSVDDYFMLVDYYTRRGYDKSDYYKFLKDINYAEAENYIPTLKMIKLERLKC